MTEERTAMLFCPPLPPLRLGTHGPVAIGRHPSCEFPLRRDDVSRRHAEVRFEQGGFVLYDLESTNGTFVNGQQVEGSQRLSPGDRIEIGSGAITFCEIASTATADWGDADAARTIVCQRPAETKQSFGGDLSEVPPSAVFQLIEMGSNSGRLDIVSASGKASVWFEAGRPIHAETEKRLGFDAAISIVATSEGQFRFGPCDETAEPTIQASVTEVLLEACRLEDEEARG